MAEWEDCHMDSKNLTIFFLICLVLLLNICLLFCSSRSDKATIIVMAIIFELVVIREVPSDLPISD